MKLLLCLLVLTCRAQAQQWQLVSSSKAAPMGHGALHVVKQIKGPVTATIHLVLFNEQQCELHVAVNSNPRTAWKLDETGHAKKALAVCNGGYFNAGGDFGPTGLEIAEGTRSGKHIADQWFGGLMVKQGKTSLVWSNEFQDSPDITEFVQCSPWLVSEGRPWPMAPGKGPEPRNNRTFVLTDGAGRWAIGICKSAGLLELAHILVTPGIITEMKVNRALNLDGGPSTGLWCQDETGAFTFEKPGWAVRNMIVVVPRISK